MAEASRPSPDTTPARLVSEAEYERIMSASMADGLHADPSGLEVEPGGLAPIFATGLDMNLVVRAGLYGSVRGFLWTSGDSNVTKTIANNTSGSTRTDYVVLELDRSTWNVRVEIVQGTPGFGLPALTRTIGSTGVFQVPIGYVTVPNGSTVSFPSSNVTVTAIHTGAPVRAWARTGDMTNPSLGEIGFDDSTGRWFGWNGLTKTYITDTLNPGEDMAGTTSADAGTTSATSFTETISGASGVSQTFTAGRQGRVLVLFGALIRNNTTWEDTLFGVRIRKVSDNSVVFTPADQQCASADISAGNSHCANFYIVSGLTPGAEYKGVGIHKVLGGTGSYDNRTIVIVPF